MLNKISQDSIICKNLKIVIGIKYEIDYINSKTLLVSNVRTYSSGNRDTFVYISDGLDISSYSVNDYIVENVDNIYVDSIDVDITSIKNISGTSIFKGIKYKIIYESKNSTLLYNEYGEYYVIIRNQYLNKSFFIFDNTKLNLKLIDDL